MYNTNYFLLALLCLLTTPLTAQSFPGLNQDNYGGLYGVLLNPASLGGTRTNAEIHLASLSGTFQSDYLSFQATDLLSALADDAYGRAVISRSSAPTPTFYGSADVLGPSLLVRLGERSGAAVFTRARTVQTSRGITGYLMEGLYGNFDELPDFTLTPTNFSATLHSWGEVGFAFGTTLLQLPSHRLRAGVTVKYLQGLGAVYTAGTIQGGGFSREDERLEVDGEVTYGRTTNYYFNELDPATRTSGTGFDLGLAYEWHPTRARDDRYPLRYKLRAAVSVVDMGGITYAAESTPYLLSGSVPAAAVEVDGDVEFALADNYDGGATQGEDADILLPATLHALIDYRLTGKLYLSGLYTSGLRNEASLYTSSVPTSLTLTARYEGRGLGLYLPVTLRSGVGTTYGVGLRAGILTIGSGSLLTHMFGDGARAADVFVGLRLPFNRKNYKKGHRGADAGAVKTA